MEITRPIFVALHIQANHQNVVGWRLVFIYMQTPPACGQATYIETHRLKDEVYAYYLVEW